ncbi:hypothetical protein IKE67_05040 [bacterium]|nr:hypothetical protein [bacterium]
MTDSTNGNIPYPQGMQLPPLPQLPVYQYPMQVSPQQQQQAPEEQSVFEDKTYKEVMKETGLRKKDVKMFDIDKNKKIDAQEMAMIKEFVGQYDADGNGKLEGSKRDKSSEWGQAREELNAMRKEAKEQAKAEGK